MVLVKFNPPTAAGLFHPPARVDFVKKHPEGCFFGADDRTRFNHGVAAVETGGKQMSTGHLHLNGCSSCTPIPTQNAPLRVHFVLVRMTGLEPARLRVGT